MTSHTPMLLSCAHTMYFWVSWTSGLISVGSGFTPGAMTLLSYDDSRHHPHEVNAISVNGASGAQWVFADVDGE